MDRRTWLATTGAAMLAADSWAQSESKSSQGELAELLEPIRAKHDVPALAGAAVVGGEVKAVGAVGRRALGHPEKVAAADKFHIGSCTKAMTATLVGLLVQQKKLRWDLPLAKALPNLAKGMHRDFRTATLELLLCARAGFPSETAPEGKSLGDIHALPGSTVQQRQAYVKLILAQKPDAAPGTKFIYSNAGYVTAGAIVEHWTKMPWEEAMRKMLFTPLGMKSAGFGWMASKGERDQPWPHVGAGANRQPAPENADNPLCLGPAGTVHVSMGDWAKFAAAHLGAEVNGKQLLADETLEKLHTPIGEQNYAMGWIAMERPWGGGKVLMHNGSNTMNYAVVWLGPKKKFAALSATNEGTIRGPAAKSCDDVAGALIGKYLRG